MRYSVIACLAAASLSAAPPLVLHPKASTLPFSHQGPFVAGAAGEVLTVGAHEVLSSTDEGRSWVTKKLYATDKESRICNERAVLRTQQGAILVASMNAHGRKAPKNWGWGVKGADWQDFILPTTVWRSLDGGKSWLPPQQLSAPWCGCVHSMIQLKSGRVVLIAQEIIPQWRHATVTWVSDDEGASWQRGDVLDYGVGTHDHAGSIEGTVIQRQDGSLYLLLRTESGYLWEATSTDGLRWAGLKQSSIPAVTCCPQMARLSDGRIALLWNAPPRHAPSNRHSRSELSLAFSSDEALTWTKPVIVAANYGPAGRVSYPYLFEAKPGLLWITTMQGRLRMSIHVADLAADEIPVHQPPAKEATRPHQIFMFGDSTTAPRGQTLVYAERVKEALQSIGSSLTVYNAGVPGNTTSQALARLQKEVLVHKPKVIVMQFGINDSAVDVWKTPPATEPRVPLASFIKNYRQMITAAQQAGARVILMTTNPLRWSSKTRELYGKAIYDPAAEDGMERPHLLAYNNALRALAKELSLPVVDVHAAYPSYAKEHQSFVGSMLSDGMHPNDLGHQLVAELLLPVIRQVLR
jgi:sialidase-1